jgi:hypothetical protein
LDTIGNVRRELGRLYRAGLSGKLESAEAARLAFILKEVRASLEVERELHLDPSTFMTTEVNVYCIPHGVQFASDGKTLIWPETGTPADPLPFTPYEATPDWTRPALTDQRLEPLAEQPIVDVVDDPKIAILHPHQRRDDPPGAA